MRKIDMSDNKITWQPLRDLLSEALSNTLKKVTPQKRHELKKKEVLSIEWVEMGDEDRSEHLEKHPYVVELKSNPPGMVMLIKFHPDIPDDPGHITSIKGRLSK